MVGYSKQLVRCRSGAHEIRPRFLYGNFRALGVGRGQRYKKRNSHKKKKKIKKRSENRPGPGGFFMIFTNYCCYYYYIPVLQQRVIPSRRRARASSLSMKPRPGRTDKIRRCGYHHLWGLDNILMSVADNDHPIQKRKTVDHI